MTNVQSTWMNQVLFKTCYLKYVTMSKTKFNTVQPIYTVLASVCSSWRAMIKLNPAVINTLRQCVNTLGNMGVCDHFVQSISFLFYKQIHVIYNYCNMCESLLAYLCRPNTFFHLFLASELNYYYCLTFWK